jgi:predicted metal-dependent phosphoesterase TrpH
MASLIDLHTHTSHSSSCSHMKAEQLIEAAIEAGLDGVAVTEHLVIEGAGVAQEIGRKKYGFPVFRGVEADSTVCGDVLVFGCYRDFAPGMNWRDLRQVVAAAGGVLIPAHPFRRWDRRSLWYYLERHDLPVDWRLADEELLEGITAIEVLNGSSRDAENAEAAELARVLVVPGVGGSDAHVPAAVGIAATLFPDDIATDQELVDALKRGDYQAVNRRS